MASKVQAPKLEAFLEQSKIMASPRETWDSFSVGSTDLLPIDARLTPVARVVQDLSRVAVVAHLSGPTTAKVSVYRFDSRDEKPWNADHYSVWFDIASQIDLPMRANRLSTSYDANMVEYLRERVHWQKDARERSNHWFNFDELPPVVRMLVGSSS